MKENHPTLRGQIEQAFESYPPLDSYQDAEQAHGRLEERRVSLLSAEGLGLDWPGLQTLIRVERHRTVLKGGVYRVQPPSVHYYLASWQDAAQPFAERIRSYWHVENKVHYPKDVSLGEDASRIRTAMLPFNMSVARDFALNLYRRAGYSNMAQAARLCSFSFPILLSLLNLK